MIYKKLISGSLSLRIIGNWEYLMNKRAKVEPPLVTIQGSASGPF